VHTNMYSHEKTWDAKSNSKKSYAVY
jgi:hypothetical protein